MAIRIAGLASGIDTESIIKEAMRAQYIRMDSVRQKRQIVEWKQEMHRDANTKFLALRNSLLDLKLQGTFMAKKVTSSEPAVLTATAGRATVEGNFQVDVVSLARGASKESTPAANDYTHTGDDASFTLNGKNGSAAITVETGDTIQDVVAKINAEQNKTGIKAMYDAGVNKFYLFTAATGSEARIEVEDTDGFLAGVLNMDTATIGGTDAVIRFNGGQELNFSSNQFTFNDINFSLLKAGQTVDINVQPDLDSVIEKFKDFVEKYNSAMGFISEKFAEKRFRDFLPLTDEQKDGMREKEIEAWEEKAKSGLLRGDSGLYSIYSKIRSQAMEIYSNPDSVFKSLSSIGITTGAWQDQGKLYIDEDKLRAALSEDLDGVMNLLTKTGEGTEQGIAVRLYDQVNDSITQIIDTAGTASAVLDDSSLGRQLNRIDKDLETIERRLIMTEDKYYRQFTVMEQAIQRMNAQSQWLMQQFNPNM